MFNFHDATQWDKDVALAWLLYRLDWQTRWQLMQEMPGTYNRITGQDVMQTERVIDRQKAATATARLADALTNLMTDIESTGTPTHMPSTGISGAMDEANDALFATGRKPVPFTVREVETITFVKEAAQ